MIKRISALIILSLICSNSFAQLKDAAEQQKLKWGAYVFQFGVYGGDHVGWGNALPDVKTSLSQATVKDGHGKVDFVKDGKNWTMDTSAEKAKILKEFREAVKGKDYVAIFGTSHSGVNEKGETRFQLATEFIDAKEKVGTRSFTYTPKPGEKTGEAPVKDADGKPMSLANHSQAPMKQQQSDNAHLNSHYIEMKDFTKIMKEEGVKGFVCATDGCMQGEHLKNSLKNDPNAKDMEIKIFSSTQANELSAGDQPAVRDKNGKVLAEAGGLFARMNDEIMHDQAKHGKNSKYDLNHDGHINLAEWEKALPKEFTPSAWRVNEKGQYVPMNLPGTLGPNGKPYSNLKQHPYSWSQGKQDEINRLNVFSAGQPLRGFIDEKGNGKSTYGTHSYSSPPKH